MELNTENSSEPIKYDSDLLVPKEEPIDVEFIKKEKTEEEEDRCFVISGIVGTYKNDDNSTDDPDVSSEGDSGRNKDNEVFMI